jgi:hypothetical protein
MPACAPLTFPTLVPIFPCSVFHHQSSAHLSSVHVYCAYHTHIGSGLGDAGVLALVEALPKSVMLEHLNLQVYSCYFQYEYTLSDFAHMI